MREMKDSEIEWVGALPSDWTLTKISALYSLRVEKVSDKDYPPLSVTMKGILPQLETAAKTNDGDNRKLVKKGDFAINSRSDRRGSCGISSYDGSVSLINTVMSPRGNMNPGYYNWLFHCSLFSDEFYRWGHGIVDDLWTTNWQDMKKITLPVPPLPEQQSIAAYLDRKCAEIDTLAADIETQIETLEQYKCSVITEAVTKGLNPDAEMKDSGIEWIGQMPVHWKTTRLKYCSTFSPKPLNRPKNENSVIEYLPMEFIKNGYYINNTEQMSNLPNSLTPFDEGDIVFAKVTPCFENGNIAIMNNLHNGYGVGSSELFVIRATLIYREFLFYWLQNSAFKAKAISTMTGMGGLKRVSGSFVQNSEIVFPSLSEQQAIADYLDRKCAEIDSLIADKRTQLNTVAEYKKSLIYEYVTGKREVPV